MGVQEDGVAIIASGVRRGDSQVDHSGHHRCDTGGCCSLPISRPQRATLWRHPDSSDPPTGASFSTSLRMHVILRVDESVLAGELIIEDAGGLLIRLHLNLS